MPSSRSLISSRFLNRHRTIGWPCILSQARCLAKIKDSRPNKPDGTRRKIYLQPLGEFPPGRSPSPERLREYATIYFGLETDTLPAVQGQDFTTRVKSFDAQSPDSHDRRVAFSDDKTAARCVLRSDDHDGGFVSGASLELRIRASLAAGARRRVQLRAIRCGVLWPRARSRSPDGPVATQL